jgi:8-oxo-(d)GTP phosphatase
VRSRAEPCTPTTIASEPQIRAAGAVLFRDGLVAVVHRPRYDDWTLPKGKLKAGEDERAAAVREVREETGFEAELAEPLAELRYQVAGRDKRVTFYTARAMGGAFRPNDEVDELRWLEPAEAAALLDYAGERAAVERLRPAP